MKLTPIPKGGVISVALIGGLAIALAVWFGPIGRLFGFEAGPPSDDLLHALAAAGVGLLIAYSAAMAGAESRLQGKLTKEKHERWLGSTVATGFCGLVAIGVALGLAERHGPPDRLLDYLGLWWIVSSLTILGITVTYVPLFHYEWRALPERTSDEADSE